MSYRVTPDCDPPQHPTLLKSSPFSRKYDYTNLTIKTQKFVVADRSI